MVKITKDYLFFYARIFPTMVILAQISVGVFIILMNFWPLYIIYALMVAAQYFIYRLLKIFQLQDLFIDENDDLLAFDTKGNITKFKKSDIIEVKTRFELTRIKYLKEGVYKDVYVTLNSKENVIHLNHNI